MENSLRLKQEEKNSPIHHEGNPFKRKRGLREFFKEMKRNRSLYMIALPAIALIFIFSYLPLFGLVIAFKNFTFDKGIFGSDWATPFYNNFIYLFTSSSAARAAVNTLFLNAVFIGAAVVFEVGFALMFNEIKVQAFKKVAQSLSFLPFFMSWIVVGVFSYNIITSSHSSFNTLLAAIGLGKIDFLTNAAIWPLILVLITRWKATGYGTVVYLAVLSGIDSTYYEAAAIDGATKWQQIRHISLPILRPTVLILVLLAVGKIFNADFGLFYSVVGDNPLLYSTTDVIDVFIYRSLRFSTDVGMASAAGFTQSVMSFLCVIGSNYVVRKFERESSLF